MITETFFRKKLRCLPLLVCAHGHQFWRGIANAKLAMHSHQTFWVHVLCDQWNYLDGSATEKMMYCRLCTIHPYTDTIFLMTKRDQKKHAQSTEAMAAPQQQQSYHTITLPLDISKASQWQHPKYLPFEKIQLKRWNSLFFSRRSKEWDSVPGSFLLSFFASCQGEPESMLSANFLASGGLLPAIVKTAAFTAVFCRA
jgi:hypothetical protein